MPILKIHVNEYECINCGYKCINRVNGKDGPVPKRCPKCKGSNWKRDEITPTENGLRRRIKAFKKLYNYAGDFWSDYSIANCWSGEPTEQFLSLDP